MDGFADVKSEFVEWSEKAEKLGEPWTNGDSEEGVPDEESDDGMFGDVAFFPGDFRMGDVGDDGGDGGGDKGREPKKVIISNNEISQNGIEGKIKDSNSDADEKVSGGVLAGFDVLGFGGSGRLCGVGLCVL